MSVKEGPGKEPITAERQRGLAPVVFDVVAADVALRQASRVKYLVACRKQMGSIGITGRRWVRMDQMLVRSVVWCGSEPQEHATLVREFQNISETKTNTFMHYKTETFDIYFAKLRPDYSKR